MKNCPEIVVIPGFGEKGIEHVEKAFQEKLHPPRIHRVPCELLELTLSSTGKNIDRITSAIDEKKLSNMWLVGDSFGSLLALIYALRRSMEGIDKLFLIDGPLRSDVSVPPSKLMFRALFNQHYREREKYAKECEIILDQISPRNIITIGSTRDRTVPPAAKRLDGCQDYTLTSVDSLRTLVPFIKHPGRKGINITLDISEMRGHRLTQAKGSFIGEIGSIMV